MFEVIPDESFDPSRPESFFNHMDELEEMLDIYDMLEPTSPESDGEEEFRELSGSQGPGY